MTETVEAKQPRHWWRWQTAFGLSVLLSLVALVWLVVLSPHEARIAVDADRVAPPVATEAAVDDLEFRVEELEGVAGTSGDLGVTLEDLDSRVSDLESSSGVSELESTVSDLDSRVNDLETSSGVGDLESTVSDLDARVSDLEARMDDVESSAARIDNLCDELSVSEGALFDLYVTAC